MKKLIIITIFLSSISAFALSAPKHVLCDNLEMDLIEVERETLKYNVTMGSKTEQVQYSRDLRASGRGGGLVKMTAIQSTQFDSFSFDYNSGIVWGSENNQIWEMGCEFELLED